MRTRQRDRGGAVVRALAADPTAVLRAPADANTAEANASEAAAPDDGCQGSLLVGFAGLFSLIIKNKSIFPFLQ